MDCSTLGTVIIIIEFEYYLFKKNTKNSISDNVNRLSVTVLEITVDVNKLQGIYLFY